MSGKVAISFASSTVADLNDILNYYTDQKVPDVGRRTIQEILTQTEDLKEHPDLGRIVPEFGMKSLRELIRPPFRIVYRRDKKRVRIVRIRRSERELKLAEL